ncbi:MAG: universal stress protein [Gaiellales bacterium]
MILERIVCGVDGSETGYEALRQARTLIPAGGRLVAVIVVEEHLAVHAGMQAPKALDDLRAEAEATRRAAEDSVAGLEQADVVVVAGHPNAVLISIAAREQANLIAVGTHSRSRRAGILLGSVTTTMLHEAPCGVLVSRPPGEAEFPSSIAAGVDGSSESAEAAKVAIALASRFGASLRLLAATGGKGGADPDSAKAISDAVDLDPRDAMNMLEDASGHADLLVLGSRGLHGVRALGSVSERMAHRARCSVLVIRRTREHVTAT